MSCPHVTPVLPDDAREIRALLARLLAGDPVTGAEDLARLAAELGRLLDSHGKAEAGTADERLAQVVVHAGAGRRAEATLAALTLLEPKVAPLLVSLSEQFALLAEVHLRAGGGL